MNQSVSGKKVLVLVASGVDESVMVTIQRDLGKAGAQVKAIGAEAGLVNSWNGNGFGLYFPIDVPINQALGADYDVLVVPSGSRSVQKLANTPHSERIISSFVAAQKPMCFIGDAAVLLEKTGNAGVSVMTSVDELLGTVPVQVAA